MLVGYLYLLLFIIWLFWICLFLRVFIVYCLNCFFGLDIVRVFLLMVCFLYVAIVLIMLYLCCGEILLRFVIDGLYWFVTCGLFCLNICFVDFWWLRALIVLIELDFVCFDAVVGGYLTVLWCLIKLALRLWYYAFDWLCFNAVGCCFWCLLINSVAIVCFLTLLFYLIRIVWLFG